MTVPRPLRSAPRSASLRPAASPEMAAIDMGSNSFRLEIGKLEHGRYRRTAYLKETVRLGGGLDTRSHLSEDAMQRGLACLARFAERLVGLGPQRIRAVATQTLREAANRDVFLARAQTILGAPVEVLSGREEARLIYAGVVRMLPRLHKPRLVVDIGGRSTELILGNGLVPQAAESFRAGSVSLSMRYFGDGRFTEQAFRDAQIAARAAFEEAQDLFSRAQWTEAQGASGTVGAVGQILAGRRAALGLPAADETITPEGLQWCIEACLRAGHVDRLDLPTLKPDRRAVIGGGLSILYTLAAQFDIDTLHSAKGALRHGVLFDLIGRRAGTHQDERDISVRGLQRQFEVDLTQARRVQRLALALFARAPDTLRSLPSNEFDAELRWAAALHELGMVVSHSEFHRHGAYIVEHADAAGFSESQKRRIGQLVLGQRGGLRKIQDALPLPGFAWQVLSLRIAQILCHARQDPPRGAVQLHSADGRAVVDLDAAWAQAHPQTMFLLEEERQAWIKVRDPIQITLVLRPRA